MGCMGCLDGVSCVNDDKSTEYSITDPSTLLISLNGNDCIELIGSGVGEAADMSCR